MSVGEGDGFLRHPETERGGAHAGTLFGLRRGKSTAPSVVNRLAVGGMGRVGGMKLGAGAEAGIYQPLRPQPVQQGGVPLCAFLLIIGRVGFIVCNTDAT